MQEQLLHFIWQRKLFQQEQLTTTQGHRVEILHPGFPNQDQGPDFLQARIKLGEELWAGHVEIHVNSSEWFLHHHESDPHYNNVILHVVWQELQPAKTMEGVIIPCVELYSRVDHDLLHRYQLLMNNQDWVPCQSSLTKVPDLIKTSWLDRLMTERLEQKTVYLRQLLDRCNQDFEQAFYVLIARHMGSPSNSDAMENLGLKISLNTLRKHGDRMDQIEAMLFGVAGMLGKEICSDYARHLKKEFDFLKVKYNLSVIPALQWKFMRMRPVHFPTVRIAQLAVIISEVPHFVTLLSGLPGPESWIRMFSVKPQNEYWDNHYHFKSSSPFLEKRIGKDMAVSLVINAVIPFMFFYGSMQGEPKLKEKAVRFTSMLPPEINSISKGWAGAGWKAIDAGQSQAMLHLKKKYCDERKCLNCAIGMQVLI